MADTNARRKKESAESLDGLSPCSALKLTSSRILRESAISSTDLRKARRLCAYGMGPQSGSTGRFFGLYEKILSEALGTRLLEADVHRQMHTYLLRYTSMVRLGGLHGGDPPKVARGFCVVSFWSRHSEITHSMDTTRRSRSRMES